MADYILVNEIRVAKCWKPETFGRLTTIGPAFRLSGGQQTQRKKYQVCQCSCGEVVVVRADHVKDGKIISCGCYGKEQALAANTSHGESHKTPEYGTWVNMTFRCNYPKSKNYHNYGGRGIKVCDRWLGPEGYQNFLADMGRRPSPQHSIDRIDVNGDYCPENCRWATAKEQANNRRNNRRIGIFGTTKTISQWAEKADIDRKTLSGRLDRGWSAENAVMAPSKRHSK